MTRTWFIPHLRRKRKAQQCFLAILYRQPQAPAASYLHVDPLLYLYVGPLLYLHLVPGYICI